MSQAAVIHCIHMIDYLAGRPDGSTLEDAARHLDVSPARARTLLETLCERGYAKAGSQPDRFLLTLKLTRLGLAYQAHSRSAEIFQAILDRLALQTGELVRMALADGERLTWVAKAQGSRSGLRFDAETGHEVTLTSTAAGKVWLAHMPTELALKIALVQGLPAKDECGPRAVRSAEGLLNELKIAAGQGYATGHDEYMLGISAIAAVIHASSPGALPLGAVSIAGPSSRLTNARLESFRRPLLGATRELSSLLPVLGESPRAILGRVEAARS